MACSTDGPERLSWHSCGASVATPTLAAARLKRACTRAIKNGSALGWVDALSQRRAAGRKP
eukprot:3334973-Pyramimonas_sp.AAC.1